MWKITEPSWKASAHDADIGVRQRKNNLTKFKGITDLDVELGPIMCYKNDNEISYQPHCGKF